MFKYSSGIVCFRDDMLVVLFFCFYLFVFICCFFLLFFFFSGIIRHTRFALVTGVQTFALPICGPQIAAELNKKLGAIDGAMVITVLPPPILGLGTAGGFKAQLEDHSNAGPAKLYDMTQALVAKARQTPSLAGVFSTYDVNTPQLQAAVARVKEIGRASGRESGGADV